MNQYMPNYLKTKNRLLIYDLIRMSQKTSRAELVRLTGMSFPTVLKIVDRLLELGIIIESEETEPPNGAGRRGHLLCFHEKAFYAVGIEFEGRLVTIGLTDLLGNCVHTHSFTLSDSRHHPNHLKHLNMETLNHQVHVLLDIAKEEGIPVLGIGIGFPAMINAEKNTVLRASSFGIHEETPFQTAFPEFFAGIDLPVFVDNEVNYACKGEAFLRRPVSSDSSLLYITLGTGCGCGLMLNDKLWYGSGHKSGEIGQMFADLKELPGIDLPGCSVPATLESRINLDALSKRFQVNLGDPMTILDPDTREAILAYLCPYLCYVISSFVLLLDINHCTLTGIIPLALGQPLLDRLQQMLDSLMSANFVQIEAAITKNTGIVGAGVTVFERCLEDLFRES